MLKWRVTGWQNHIALPTIYLMAESVDEALRIARVVNRWYSCTQRIAE